MTMLASQISSLPVVCSIVYSDVNQSKHQSSASLAFVREIHRGPVNFPHKWPVTRKMFPFDDVIMIFFRGRTQHNLSSYVMGAFIYLTFCGLPVFSLRYHILKHQFSFKMMQHELFAVHHIYGIPDTKPITISHSAWTHANALQLKTAVVPNIAIY